MVPLDSSVDTLNENYTSMVKSSVLILFVVPALRFPIDDLNLNKIPTVGRGENDPTNYLCAKEYRGMNLRLWKFRKSSSKTINEDIEFYYAYITIKTEWWYFLLL